MVDDCRLLLVLRVVNVGSVVALTIFLSNRLVFKLHHKCILLLLMRLVVLARGVVTTHFIAIELPAFISRFTKNRGGAYFTELKSSLVTRTQVSLKI
jgi:hypothetical protein